MGTGAKIFKHVNNKKGMAMVYVLIIFLIIAIFASTVIGLFSSNLRLARRQEDSVEAYYLAYSGIQMAFTSLQADDNELFNEIKDGTTASLSEDDVAFGNGTIDIMVTKSTESNYNGWIKIVATGTLDKNNVSRTRTIYIDSSNQKNVAWKEH